MDHPLDYIRMSRVSRSLCLVSSTLSTHGSFTSSSPYPMSTSLPGDPKSRRRLVLTRLNVPRGTSRPYTVTRDSSRTTSLPRDQEGHGSPTLPRFRRIYLRHSPVPVVPRLPPPTTCGRFRCWFHSRPSLPTHLSTRGWSDSRRVEQ